MWVTSLSALFSFLFMIVRCRIM
uniref:Uncharacterized protein n=1 Tax=Anguilla anguilla TaxID=7936 RepID=A0A0E9VXQ6_ANGAN